MLKLRSVSLIVIAPARTGNDNNSLTAVIRTAYTNLGLRCIDNPGARMLIIVVIKFSAPKIDDAPARCNEKIALSTDGPECATEDDNGG